MFTLRALFTLEQSADGGDQARPAAEVREKVGRWTGIPVSIGLPPTKTLAKLTGRAAKPAPRIQGRIQFRFQFGSERSFHPQRFGFVFVVVSVMQMHRRSFRFAQAQVQDFDENRERHREIDITFRDVLV